MSSGETVSERQTIIDVLQDAGLSCLVQLKNAAGQAFDSLGLTYGQAMLLHFVGRGHTTPNELIQLLGIVPTSLSAMVTKLVEINLIERQSIGTDARRVFIALTPRGQNACTALEEAWREHFPLDLNSLSDEELTILIGAARIATKRKLV